MRRTKIICTLGPACRDEETVLKMIKSGMNVARLNFSHQDHDFHRENIAMLKRLRALCARPLALLLDTKGPEIRTGILHSGTVQLNAGEKFVLTTKNITGDKTTVSVSFSGLPQSLKRGDIVLLDDGKIRLLTEEITDTDIICRVQVGGILGNTRGINIPDVPVSMPFLSEKDKSDIILGIKEGIDYIAASFVRTADDLRVMRTFLFENGGKQIKIIAKIECRQALDNFEEILREADGIMVARGDLGVEVPFENLPGLQKKMIARCFKSGKMAVTATQMLESMINGAYPTRAETNDVANAVFDRSSAVMLSGETAIGVNPALVVETMSRICDRAGRDIRELGIGMVNIHPEPLGNSADAVCEAAVTAAENIGAAAIIALTTGGATARLVAKYRPEIPIIAATVSEQAYNQLAANWGVEPILIEKQTDIELLFLSAITKAVEKELIKSGDKVVLVCGATNSRDGEKNLIKIMQV